MSTNTFSHFCSWLKSNTSLLYDQTNVYCVVIRISHRHMSLCPEIFTNPLEFNPDRFAEGGEGTKNKRVQLEWGFGSRMCLGKRAFHFEISCMDSLWLTFPVVDFHELALCDAGNQAKGWRKYTAKDEALNKMWNHVVTCERNKSVVHAAVYFMCSATRTHFSVKLP